MDECLQAQGWVARGRPSEVVGHRAAWGRAWRSVRGSRRLGGLSASECAQASDWF